MSIRSLLSRAKELFVNKEDQAKLDALERISEESISIRITMDSDGGKALKNMLVNDFFTSLDNLFRTNDQLYIAELKATMRLIDKISTNQDESIKSYLESKLKDYA